MKRGEKIIVERTKSGLYKITNVQGTVLIGAAASTAMTIINEIFVHEACGDTIEGADAA